MKSVSCDRHGKGRSGYVACLHVVDGGEPAVHAIPPSGVGDMGKIGSIACARGYDAHDVDELTLVCERCAIEKGWVR